MQEAEGTGDSDRTGGAPDLGCREVLVDNTLLDPQRVLNTAVVAIRRNSEANQIFLEWPNLRAMSLRLVEYLSPVYPGPKGGPLIEDCLRLAIDSYLAEERRSQVDQQKIGRFILGLLSPAPFVFKSLLYAQEDDGRWRCWEFFSQPVTHWLVKNEGRRLLVSPAPKDGWRPHDWAARAFLCANVVRPSDFRLAGDIMHEICTSTQIQALHVN